MEFKGKPTGTFRDDARWQAALAPALHGANRPLTNGG